MISQTVLITMGDQQPEWKRCIPHAPPLFGNVLRNLPKECGEICTDEIVAQMYAKRSLTGETDEESNIKPPSTQYPHSHHDQQIRRPASTSPSPPFSSPY